jgi:hypothetical protein
VTDRRVTIASTCHTLGNIAINVTSNKSHYIYVICIHVLSIHVNYKWQVMRIRMIRVFIWYARSYDARNRMIHAFVDDTHIPVFDWLIMICVWYAYHTGIVCYYIRERYFTFWDLSYFYLKNEYNEDKFNGHMQCLEHMAFPGFKFQNFSGGECPRTSLPMWGVWKCYGQIFGWTSPWNPFWMVEWLNPVLLQVFDVLRHARVIYHLVYINQKELKNLSEPTSITILTANQSTQENQI